MSTPFRSKVESIDQRCKTDDLQGLQTRVCINLLFSTANLLDGFIEGIANMLRKPILIGKLASLDKAVSALTEDEEGPASATTAEIAALAKEMREKANELYGGDLNSDDVL